MEDDSDEKLVARLKKGEMTVFAKIVMRYEIPLFRWGLKLFGNAEDAEDAVQKTFLQVFQKIQTYQPRESFKSWIGQLMLNNFRMELRASRHKRKVPLYDEHEANEERESLDKDEIDLLFKAMASLSNEHREILVLQYLDSSTYEEMAVILKIPIGTVRSRLSIAKENLREIILDR